uniref:DUF7041 domain-containing protein n=1 Tax=Schistocephalus solidus TaxID=70667 RepID=A0A0X3NTJ4_SCHSO
MTDNETNADSLDVHSLSFKLPPFTPSNPRVWFRQIEAVFSTRRITSERTRYSYVVQSLPFDVAVDVEDLLDPIPAEEPYTQLKDAVINRVAKSANRMLRELFTQVELGDQTPSQLMRHMRSLLAGRHMDDAIFRQIWLDKLPLPMQQVLAMLDTSTSLDKLATHADRIMECYPSGTACSSLQQTSVSTSRSDNIDTPAHQGTPKSERDPPYVTLSSCCSAYRRAAPSSDLSQASNIVRSSDYEDLKDTVRLLCTQVSNMCSIINNLQSNSRQTYQRRRSKSREWQPQTVCWYHRTYGVKARKCIPPCKFPQKPQQLNDNASQ